MGSEPLETDRVCSKHTFNVDPATGVTILSDKISVKPEVKGEVSGVAYFTVAVEGQRAGDYKGMLELKYADQPCESPLNIDLDVHFTRPSVEADTSSRNLILLLQPSWRVSRFMRAATAPGAHVLAVAGRNLKPGEYNGAVLIKVNEQKEPVQVSLQIKVKDGLLVPRLILAIGPIVGALLAWWNKQGSELSGVH